MKILELDRKIPSICEPVKPVKDNFERLQLNIIYHSMEFSYF